MCFPKWLVYAPRTLSGLQSSSIASVSWAHTVELKWQLQNLQKGNLSIFDYLLKIKLLLMNYWTLAIMWISLPEEYDPVVINVAAANHRTMVLLIMFMVSC